MEETNGKDKDSLGNAMKIMNNLFQLTEEIDKSIIADDKNGHTNKPGSNPPNTNMDEKSPGITFPELPDPDKFLEAIVTSRGDSDSPNASLEFKSSSVTCRSSSETSANPEDNVPPSTIPAPSIVPSAEGKYLSSIGAAMNQNDTHGLINSDHVLLSKNKANLNKIVLNLVSKNTQIVNFINKIKHGKGDMQDNNSIPQDTGNSPASNHVNPEKTADKKLNKADENPSVIPLESAISDPQDGFKRGNKKSSRSKKTTEGIGNNSAVKSNEIHNKRSHTPSENNTQNNDHDSTGQETNVEVQVNNDSDTNKTITKQSSSTNSNEGSDNTQTDLEKNPQILEQEDDEIMVLEVPPKVFPLIDVPSDDEDKEAPKFLGEQNENSDYKQSLETCLSTSHTLSSNPLVTLTSQSMTSSDASTLKRKSNDVPGYDNSEKRRLVGHGEDIEVVQEVAIEVDTSPCLNESGRKDVPTHPQTNVSSTTVPSDTCNVVVVSDQARIQDVAILNLINEVKSSRQHREQDTQPCDASHPEEISPSSSTPKPSAAKPSIRDRLGSKVSVKDRIGPVSADSDETRVSIRDRLGDRVETDEDGILRVHIDNELVLGDADPVVETSGLLALGITPDGPVDTDHLTDVFDKVFVRQVRIESNPASEISDRNVNLTDDDDRDDLFSPPGFSDGPDGFQTLSEAESEERENQTRQKKRRSAKDRLGAREPSREKERRIRRISDRSRPESPHHHRHHSPHHPPYRHRSHHSPYHPRSYRRSPSHNRRHFHRSKRSRSRSPHRSIRSRSPPPHRSTRELNARNISPLRRDVSPSYHERRRDRPSIDERQRERTSLHEQHSDSNERDQNMRYSRPLHSSQQEVPFHPNPHFQANYYHHGPPQPYNRYHPPSFPNQIKPQPNLIHIVSQENNSHYPEPSPIMEHQIPTGFINPMPPPVDCIPIIPLVNPFSAPPPELPQPSLFTQPPPPLMTAIIPPPQITPHAPPPTMPPKPIQPPSFSSSDPTNPNFTFSFIEENISKVQNNLMKKIASSKSKVDEYFEKWRENGPPSSAGKRERSISPRGNRSIQRPRAHRSSKTPTSQGSARMSISPLSPLRVSPSYHRRENSQNRNHKRLRRSSSTSKPLPFSNERTPSPPSPPRYERPSRPTRNFIDLSPLRFSRSPSLEVIRENRVPSRPSPQRNSHRRHSPERETSRSWERSERWTGPFIHLSPSPSPHLLSGRSRSPKNQVTSVFGAHVTGCQKNSGHLVTQRYHGNETASPPSPKEHHLIGSSSRPDTSRISRSRSRSPRWDAVSPTRSSSSEFGNPLDLVANPGVPGEDDF